MFASHESMHLLSLLLIVPILGILIISFLPSQAGKLARAIAILVSFSILVIAVSIYFWFDIEVAKIQLFETYTWNQRLGTSFTLGLDGFSYPMVVLASLLCFVAILASNTIKERNKAYYILMLLLEMAMLGVFMARDWALFYLFWELTLIPLFLLIDRWGGKNRQGASINFVLYTMGGSVFMLISILVLYDSLPDKSFSMATMIEGAKSIDSSKQLLIFLGLLIGFGVKMPIFPIHGWLPLAHVEAPSPVSILLSGILLKMGSYGIIRAAELLPKAIAQMQTVLMVLAFTSLIYGGLLAWRQTDLKRMIAYSSISHMGVVLLGIAAMNSAGLNGAIMQMVAHGLVAGLLFLLIGLLYERTHTRDVNDYSSLVRITPRFAFFTIFAFVASVGLPGTAGFIAELHTLVGGYERWGLLIILLAMGVLVSAAYAIRTVGRLFTGPVHENMKEISDLRPNEMIAAALLAICLLVIGLFPNLLLDITSTSVDKLSMTLSVK